VRRRPTLIVRELLRGATAVCSGCRRALEPGEPRVTIPPTHPNGAVLLRCAYCEYRAVNG